MNRGLTLLLIAFAASPTASRTATADDASSDVQDILYLADEHPVFLRLHIRIDDRSYRAVWNEYVDDYFHELDKDGDGKLSAEEARRLSKPSQPKTLGTADTLLKNAKEILDSVGDLLSSGKKEKKSVELSKADVIARLQAAGQMPFSVKTVQETASLMAGMSPRSATDELLSRLDRDGNKRLSREEFLSAHASMGKVDLDDDETVSRNELQTSNPYAVFIPQQNRAVQHSSAAFVVIDSNGDMNKMAADVLEKYRSKEADRQDGLTRAETGLSQTAFARADTNDDDRLDVAELAHLLREPPATLELIVRLGERGERPAIEVVSSDQTKDDPVAVRIAPGGVPSIVSRSTQVDFSADASATGAYGFESLVTGQFSALDRDNNGYLDEKEAASLGGLNPAEIDADGDKKVLKEELVAYLEKRAESARSRTEMTVTGPRRDLFEILDANGDQRLNQREFRAAADQFAIWDRNGDGQLSKGEFPQQFRLKIGPGTTDIQMLSQLQAAASIYGPVTQPSVSGSGPAWFQKMDRNHDGDLSWREFLYDASLFEKIDSNADGLISGAEADDLP